MKKPLPPGFISCADFAHKLGVSYAHVINWTLTGAIPFQTREGGKYKMIPEHEAMESEVVKASLAKRAAKGIFPPAPSNVPPMQPVSTMQPVPFHPPQEVYQRIITPGIQPAEKIFLLARRQAEPYILRAKALRKEGKCQAEAEVLWLAIECFGYNPE